MPPGAELDDANETANDDDDDGNDDTSRNDKRSNSSNRNNEVPPAVSRFSQKPAVIILTYAQSA